MIVLSLCDIHPLSEFQRGAKAFLVKIKETKTPIILTVNGKGDEGIVRIHRIRRGSQQRIQSIDELLGIEEET